MSSPRLQTQYFKDQLAFLDQQILTEPSVNHQIEFDFQGLRRSYQGKEDHPISGFVARFGRIWVYDIALSIYADLKAHRVDQAMGQAKRLVQLALQEERQGYHGLWHFSYNTVGDDFIDPRGPAGANAWCLNALYAAVLQSQDSDMLDWINWAVENYLLKLQVLEKEDPRFGLIRAGLYNADDVHRDKAMGYDVFGGDLNRTYQHVILEHCADAAGTLRLAYRANKKFNPQEKKFIEILIERHDWLLQGMRRCFWQGDHFVSAIDPHGEFYKGTDGKPSIAVDNNTWPAHIYLPYDVALAQDSARYVEKRFLTKTPPAQVEDLPEGTTQMGLEGVFFFPATFEDPFVHVPEAQRPRLEKLLHPEAALGYVVFLMDLADYIRDPEQTRLRQRALRLYEDTADLQSLYGSQGAPYATVNITEIFSTLHSVTTAATGVVATAILEGEPGDDFIGVLPPKRFTVDGKSPKKFVDA